MKQFHDETLSAHAAANAVIETAWRVLGLVKAEVTRAQPTNITPTQMRSLGYLLESPGASLSELAEDLGLQMPTTSKVVEEMVQKRWVVRDVVPDNRRKLALYVTAKGTKAVERAAEPAMTRVAELLAQLNPKDRKTVARAMAILLPLVMPANLRDRGQTNAA